MYHFFSFSFVGGRDSIKQCEGRDLYFFFFFLCRSIARFSFLKVILLLFFFTSRIHKISQNDSVMGHFSRSFLFGKMGTIP